MNVTDELWVLVPLKHVQRGKERLASVLPEQARQALIAAMLEDVISALLAVPIAAQRVLLVTEDDAAQSVAQRFGISLYQPRVATDDPLNAALDEAAAFVASQGGTQLMIVHADVPLAGADDLRACIAGHTERCRTRETAVVTLVTDRMGEGTNCLLVSPPLAIAFQFGVNSRGRHRAACAAQAADYDECINAGLARDIDYPPDLAELVRLCQSRDSACGTATRTLVLGWRDKKN